MFYEQLKIDAVVARIEGKTEKDRFADYFKVEHEFRKPILDIFYYDSWRANAIVNRDRMPTELEGYFIIPWDVRDVGVNEPFPLDDANLLWMSREMLKYLFILNAAGHWEGRKVHEVGSGSNLLAVYLHKCGAEVIATNATSESLMVGAANMIEHGVHFDYKFYIDSVPSTERNSDAYIFNNIFYEYGVAQWNLDLMRSLAEEGKEVLFTAPYISRDFYPEMQTVCDLQTSEYDVIHETEYLGDPETWGARQVLRMK